MHGSMFWAFCLSLLTNLNPGFLYPVNAIHHSVSSGHGHAPKMTLMEQQPTLVCATERCTHVVAAALVAYIHIT
eukprot:3842173-Amphidinium_carterae.2